MYFLDTSGVPLVQRHAVRVTDINNDKIINHCLPEIGNRDIYKTSIGWFWGNFFYLE